jgi:cellulase/cellobiase CelA1
MTMLAEVVDAVIGGDTHRDTHALEVLAPNGATITTLAIDNDDGGFVDAIAWIAEHPQDHGSSPLGRGKGRGRGDQTAVGGVPA